MCQVVQMLRSEQKSPLSDRSEPHLAFDDHKMLEGKGRARPKEQTSFSHICVSPLTHYTSLSSLWPPPPPAFYNFLILLPWFPPPTFSTTLSVQADDSSVMSCCIHHRISVCYYSCVLLFCTIHNLKKAGFISQWPDSSPWQCMQWRDVSLSSSLCKHAL